MSADLPAWLAAELATVGDRLGDRLVARSSSRLEAGGEWAGAFTSYVDVGPADLPTAVRGCWASAFGVDALRRFEAAGIAPDAAPMAVLIQPFVSARGGGSARLEGSVVEIVAGPGSPADVL
jgi:pyruvate,water dikinase